MTFSNFRWLAGLAALLLAVAMAAPVAAEWNKGLEAYNKRDYATAAKEFEEVTKTNPDYAGGYYMLGVCQRSLGNLSPALASLRKAVELEPGNASYKVGLGQAQLQGERYQDAYTTLKDVNVSSIDAKHRSAYALLFAQAATKTNRPAEAIQLLTTQTKADPNDARLFQALGAAQSAAGDDAKAFAAFKKAYELDPSDTGIGRNAVKTGIAAARRTNSPQKEQIYSGAAQIAEKLAAAEPIFDHKLLAGEAWLGAGEYQKALSWFDQAKAAQPQNVLVQYYHAQCNTSLNRLDPAIDDLQTALKIGATGKLRTQIYNQMGYVYDKKKDYKSAASAYRDAGNQSKVAEMEKKSEAQAQNVQAEAEQQEFRRKLAALELQIKELEAIGEMDEANELRKQLDELKKALPQ
jgi:tetratricopeptide (TPR) repeat protein